MKTAFLSRFIAGTAIICATPGINAQSLKIELPPERPDFKPASGAELVTANCLICHSSEYIRIQPVLGRTYWEGAVAKMQKVFGANIPPDQVGPIVDYLVKNYGKDAPAPPAAAQKGADR
jgi:mono/diheme cytochrome c family protein